MLKGVTWYLGGYSLGENPYASLAYIAERGNEGSSAPGAHLTYIGNVGLIYTSDYGYAAESSDWDIRITEYSNLNSSVWLYNGENQWFMQPHSYDTNILWGLDSYGDGIYYPSSFGNEIRPVLYLNSEVKFSGGTGSESELFLLEI